MTRWRVSARIIMIACDARVCHSYERYPEPPLPSRFPLSSPTRARRGGGGSGGATAAARRARVASMTRRCTPSPASSRASETRVCITRARVIPDAAFLSSSPPSSPTHPRGGRGGGGGGGGGAHARVASIMRRHASSPASSRACDAPMCQSHARHPEHPVHNPLPSRRPPRLPPHTRAAVAYLFCSSNSLGRRHCFDTTVTSSRRPTDVANGVVRADVGADEPDVGALPRRARVKQSADPPAGRLARHHHADGGANPRADSGAAPRADDAVPDGDIRVGAVCLDRRRQLRVGRDRCAARHAPGVRRRGAESGWRVRGGRRGGRREGSGLCTGCSG